MPERKLHLHDAVMCTSLMDGTVCAVGGDVWGGGEGRNFTAAFLSLKLKGEKKKVIFSREM